MSKKVVESLTWRWGSMNNSSVHDLHADYTNVLDSSDLSEKADISYVDKKIDSISKVLSTEKKQLEDYITAIKESVEESLSSNERIENEKEVLSSFFNLLTSGFKKECQEIEIQIRKEVEAYQSVDNSLNEKLSLLISQKEELDNTYNKAYTTINELEKQLSLTDDAVNKLKDISLEIEYNNKKRTKKYSFVLFILFINIFLLDIFFLYIYLFR